MNFTTDMFSVRYELNSYIIHLSFTFKGLRT